MIDAPTWTFDYGFDPQMGEAIGSVTQRCRGILLGRTTFEMFEPAWSTRTVPGGLSLAACESYDNGVVYLAYRPQA